LVKAAIVFMSTLRIMYRITETATHHLAPTSHSALNPNEGLLIPQTFLPRIPALPTCGESIVANNAATTAGIAAFAHGVAPAQQD
jgi:hypothetical protein